MADPNLVTTCNFHGQEFLFKMNVLGNNLEILITDKNSGEEWQCSYDATYIENLTHKTGNFKQFDIFITMIKSGLLRTSECVTLDLLTYEDLELLRSRKITKACGQNSNSNRRYLIITYCVEFDKIRYPLPLEYCGPPDPLILQATIRRLELELSRAREELMQKNHCSESRKIYSMQKRIDELTDDNFNLQEEIKLMSKLIDKKPRSQIVSLQKAMDKLEKSVVCERNSHHELVEKLRNDKIMLAKELDRVKCSEKNLKTRIRGGSQAARLCYGDGNKFPGRKKSDCSINTVYRRNKSPMGEFSRIEERSERSRSQKRDWDDIPRPSRIDFKPNLPKHRSRSSSTNSVKYPQEPQSAYYSMGSPSPRFSRPQSPAERSRSSSVTSKCSSRCSEKRLKSPRGGKSEIDFKKLEEKIESLQKMLKRNFIK